MKSGPQRDEILAQVTSTEAEVLLLKSWVAAKIAQNEFCMPPDGSSMRDYSSGTHDMHKSGKHVLPLPSCADPFSASSRLSSKYTIDGDGPLAGRRFDLRFFVLVARGRVYLHTNGWAKWTTGGPRYDPLDTDLARQVPNVAAYAGDDTARLVFHHDLVGPWARGGSGGGGGRSGRRGLDPHGWRNAVADALEIIKGPVLGRLVNRTAADPATYVLLGTDALIRSDGMFIFTFITVFIIEFMPV